MEFTFQKNRTNKRIYKIVLTEYKHEPNYYKALFQDAGADYWENIGNCKTEQEAQKVIKKHKEATK